MAKNSWGASGSKQQIVDIELEVVQSDDPTNPVILGGTGSNELGSSAQLSHSDGFVHLLTSGSNKLMSPWGGSLDMFPADLRLISEAGSQITLTDKLQTLSGANGYMMTLHSESLTAQTNMGRVATFSADTTTWNDNSQDVITFSIGKGKYKFNAATGGNSGMNITGSTKLTGSANNYNILEVNGGGMQYSTILCAKATGSGANQPIPAVGIGTSQPKVALDVAHNPTGLSSNEGGGEVVYFGQSSGDLIKGALYYLHTSGQWMSASADGTGSGNSQLLGISMGATMPDNGMLIRGWYNVSTRYSEDFIPGGAVYIKSGSQSSGYGFMSGAAPIADNSYSRIVGYGTPNSYVIYFNPSSNWIELTGS